jgi:hypothetical protein
MSRPRVWVVPHTQLHLPHELRPVRERNAARSFDEALAEETGRYRLSRTCSSRHHQATSGSRFPIGDRSLLWKRAQMCKQRKLAIGEPSLAQEVTYLRTGSGFFFDTLAAGAPRFHPSPANRRPQFRPLRATLGARTDGWRAGWGNQLHARPFSCRGFCFCRSATSRSFDPILPVESVCLAEIVLLVSFP